MLFRSLTESVKDALKYNSQNTREDEVEKLMIQFVDALKSRYNQVQIEDVKKGILNGTYGDYGKYNWVNTKVLIDWVRQNGCTY